MENNFGNNFKDCVLDHIAIAVKSIEVNKKVYEDLGLKFSDKREIVKSQLVETAFAMIDQHAHIELLQPTEEKGAIYDFIQKKGEGIHHMAFLVKDVVAKQLELEAKGYRFIYEKAQVGANNKKINFIHPKSCGGVLIEISEEM